MVDNSSRVVVLVDMDCFYCQVEVRLNPEHKGKPLAVVQYNAWKGGGIIAVNYEARDRGVTRHMRGDEAKKICPEIILVKVPEVRGKADLTKYRDAGKEVVEVLHDFSSCIQRASVDEAYMDITEAVEERTQLICESEVGISPCKLSSTFIIGYCDDKSNDEDKRVTGLRNWLDTLSDSSRVRLAVGAMISEEMRAAVYERTGFRCSAGISHNKVLAKLVCGVHKPNRQTVLPPEKVDAFFSTLPVCKVKNLGGKFGVEVVELLGCQTMGDLARFSLRELQQRYDEKTGTWLYNIARGIDNEPVTVRLIPKSIGCSKNFPGRTALSSRKAVEHWMRELVTELVVRLTQDQEENKRRAQLLVVSVSQDTEDGSSGSSSRSGPLPVYDVDKVVTTALQLINRTNYAPASSLAWSPALKHIGLSAGKFVDDSCGQKSSIESFFSKASKQAVSATSKQDVKSQPKSSAVTSRRPSIKDHFLHADHSSSNQFLDNSVKNVGNSPHYKTSSSSSTASSVKSHFIQVLEHDCAQDQNTSFDLFEVPAENSEGKRNNNAEVEEVFCPEKIEDAVPYSFFAKYIVNMRQNKNSLISDHSDGAKPSTSGLNNQPPHGTFQSDVASVHQNSPQPSTSYAPSPTHVANKNSDSDTSSDERLGGEKSSESEQCSECGKLVPLTEFPEHMDYHSAVRLERELNASQSTTETTHHSPKTDDLHIIQPSSVATTGTTDDEESEAMIMEKCSYCSKLIPLSEFPEHIDYHSALELQQELNRVRPTDPIPAATAPSNPSTLPGKRKKGKGKQVSSPVKKVKNTNIASFFAPK